jgi:hypothetical protein
MCVTLADVCVRVICAGDLCGSFAERDTFTGAFTPQSEEMLALVCVRCVGGWVGG